MRRLQLQLDLGSKVKVPLENSSVLSPTSVREGIHRADPSDLDHTDLFRHVEGVGGLRTVSP